MTFIRAIGGPPNIGDPKSKFTVQYFDEEGNMTIRSGGSRAGRCNNPGALISSAYSMGKDRHPIGRAGDASHTYAVYPDYATGHEALIVMLRGSRYAPLTLTQASKRYVAEDPNHYSKIIKLTAKRLDPERTIQSLTDEEFDSYWKATEKNEHWEVGREDCIERRCILGVHKKHGTITEYLVEQQRGVVWLSKVDALKLAKAFRIRATLVRLRTGTCYLRPDHGFKAFKTLA